MVWALLGCQREFSDGACYGDPRVPLATQPFVGLFHRDGRPAFRRARVWVSYNDREVELGPDPRLAAELLSNGRQAAYLAVPPDRTGNYFGYVRGVTPIPMYPCALPMRYRVEAEGCISVQGVWSWNDNTWPERADLNFHVPVRLDCTGDDLPPDAASPADATAP